MSKPSPNRSFQKQANLNKLFLLSISALWISVTPVIFNIHRVSKMELGQALVDSARESLLVGDNRTAMIILGKGIPKWFNSVRIEKQNGNKVFEFSTEVHSISLQLTIPIWLTENNVPYGYAKFSYPLLSLLLTIAFWLIASSLIVFLIFQREKKRFLQELANRNRILRLEVENNLARQVSHDIRSPLSAISMLMGTSDLNTTDARTLLKSAASRIKEIAQDLLNRSKSGVDAPLSLEGVMIDDVIREIITEKKIEYRDLENISFEVSLGATNSAVRTNKIEFSRVLSNLINNSIEAKKDNPLIIKISTTVNDQNIEFIISDNGTGIPEHILSELGKRKISFGKEDAHSGSGQGVFHAHEIIINSGGTFIITSEVGSGTRIRINLPVINASRGFNSHSQRAQSG